MSVLHYCNVMMLIHVQAQEAAHPEQAQREEQLGRLFADEGDIGEEHEQRGQDKIDALALYKEGSGNKKELKPVNHATIDYLAIRKNLYIVPSSLAKLSSAEVAARREEMLIKIRGKGCPPPVETWDQCGLSERILALIKKQGFEAPFNIQKQAVPALMSGRDVIGVASTGSGKTLAFLLPMFRHIMDQPTLGEGEGPVGIIMAPARELALQIYSEARRIAKAVGLRVTAVYGGAGVADQVSFACSVVHSDGTPFLSLALRLSHSTASPHSSA